MFYMSGSQIGKRKRGARRFTKSQKGKRVIRIQPRQRGALRVGGYYGRYANGGELKFHDVDVTQAAADWSGGLIQNAGTLNVIPQDVTEKTRVGRKVTLKSIMWRGVFTTNVIADGATTQSADVVRVIIYLDKQCNGETATVLNILETADYLSFKNLANTNRFQTVYDKIFTVKPEPPAGTGAVNDQGAGQTIKSFYKKCNIRLEYDDSAQTGALGTIRSNNIGMLLISKNSSSNVVMDSKVRMRFSDA